MTSRSVLNNELVLVQAIVTNTLDDVDPLLKPEEIEALRDYRRQVIGSMRRTAEVLTHTVLAKRSCLMAQARKAFAQEVACQPASHLLVRIWGLLDRRPDPHSEICRRALQLIADEISRARNVDDVRHLFGGHRWDGV